VMRVHLSAADPWAIRKRRGSTTGGEGLTR
jgi:hypothetical protein